MLFELLVEYSLLLIVMHNQESEFAVQEADRILRIVLIVLEKLRKFLPNLSIPIVLFHVFLGVIEFDVVGIYAVPIPLFL